MSFLHAFGCYLPERVVSNAEMAARVGKSAEWIESSSGIRERRWAGPETSVADLALGAAQDCLTRAGIQDLAPRMIVVASGSARPGFPGPAVEVAERLGLEGVPAIDLPMASAGSLFGLALASRIADAVGEVLVIGAEKMSAIIEGNFGAPGHVAEAAPLDPNTAILFGDGAGAALVSPRPGPWRIVDSVLHSDGHFREDLAFDWTSPLRMNGLAVILQASRKIPGAISEVLVRNQVAPADVSAFLLHQANQNLLMRVAKSIGVPGERLYSNVARYGNTSSASMLIAAAEWSRENPQPGPVVFAAFGAGFHWGTLLATSA